MFVLNIVTMEKVLVNFGDITLEDTSLLPSNAVSAGR
jgi:hypothetical protein